MPDDNGIRQRAKRVYIGANVKKAQDHDSREGTQMEPHAGSVEGDRWNIALLLFLYTLQGLPMGLAGSVPFLLQEAGATFSEQATFSLASWPYSLKILWAPLVDVLYFKRFGRRKTWLVPVQLLVGVLMIVLGPEVQSRLLEQDEPDIKFVTAVFFTFYFLVATQDIAVDGWALTLLKPQNVGYASTCNTVGQTIGFMTSYAIFLALNSADFCNRWLRPASGPQEYGVVDLKSFMVFWGFVFIISTVLLIFFKHELAVVSKKRGRSESAASHPSDAGAGEDATSAAISSPGGAEAVQRRMSLVADDDFEHMLDEMTRSDDDDDAVEDGALLGRHGSEGRQGGGGHHEPKELDFSDLGIVNAYKLMLRVVVLPPILTLVAFLFTSKIAFAVTDSSTMLELVERGVSKESLAAIAVSFTPIEVIFSGFMSRYTAGSKPISLYLSVYVPRILLCLTYVALMASLPEAHLRGSDGVPLWWMGAAIVNLVLYRMCSSTMFMAQIAFFTKVADPIIGGAYMTLLNTMANLGSMWVSPVALMAMSKMDARECLFDTAAGADAVTGATYVHPRTNVTTVVYHGMECMSGSAMHACKAVGAACVTVSDGYTWLTFACAFAGLVWLVVFRRRSLELEALPKQAWAVMRKRH